MAKKVTKNWNSKFIFINITTCMTDRLCWDWQLDDLPILYPCMHAWELSANKPSPLSKGHKHSCMWMCGIFSPCPQRHELIGNRFPASTTDLFWASCFTIVTYTEYIKRHVVCNGHYIVWPLTALSYWVRLARVGEEMATLVLPSTLEPYHDTRNWISFMMVGQTSQGGGGDGYPRFTLHLRTLSWYP